VKVFKLESAQPYGWVVSLEDSMVKPHFFPSREVALAFATTWAQAHRPSRLEELNLQGRKVEQWVFDEDVVEA
jgi:hypothetical protein